MVSRDSFTEKSERMKQLTHIFHKEFRHPTSADFRSFRMYNLRQKLHTKMDGILDLNLKSNEELIDLIRDIIEDEENETNTISNTKYK